MEEEKYLVSLCAFTEFGPYRVSLLLSYFKSAKKIWSTKESELIETGLNKNLVQRFIKHREHFDCVKYFLNLKRYGINYVTKKNPFYPVNLKGLEDAPVVLYFLGNLDDGDSNSVAVVGSRKMTDYGRNVTRMFVSELAGKGVVVISGLARGIDTIAHRSALSAGGKTIAVLGNGLDRVYPPENYNLFHEIVKRNGAILSEYPLGYPPYPSNFPLRNRIVSGMAKAVLVVEGLIKSGTIITASRAADQGRTVFAVPGEITAPSSGASHFLIQNGAKIAFSPKDILDELGFQDKVNKRKNIGNN